MEPNHDDDLTALLRRAAEGDRSAAGSVYRRVHETLLRIAEQRMRFERKDHTLQAPDLVHEAWIKLVGDKPVNWSSRGQFYAAAASAMRQILIDHARRHGAAKRGGGGLKRHPLSVADLAVEYDAEDVLALDDAIKSLEQDEPEVGAVVRLRFFAGLTVEETAAALNQSPRSVNRLWNYARARLYRLIAPDA